MHTTRGSLAELPGQLAVAHVHGVDLPGAVLQHTVRKAAGGGADVAADRNRSGSMGKVRHGLFQLQTAPAHIRAGCAHGPRWGHHWAPPCRACPPAGPLTNTQPAHDDGLCLLAALLPDHCSVRSTSSLVLLLIGTSPPLPHLPHRQRPGRTDAAAAPPCPAGQSGPSDFARST